MEEMSCFDCKYLNVKSISHSENGELDIESYCINLKGLKKDFEICKLFLNR